MATTYCTWINIYPYSILIFINPPPLAALPFWSVNLDENRSHTANQLEFPHQIHRHIRHRTEPTNLHLDVHSFL